MTTTKEISKEIERIYKNNQAGKVMKMLAKEIENQDSRIKTLESK